MTLGQVFTTVIADAKKAASAVVGLIGKADALAPTVEAITAAINPGAAQAEAAVIDILDAIKSAIVAAKAAGGTPSTTGVSLSIGAELVAAFEGAEATILADLNKLGVKL